MVVIVIWRSDEGRRVEVAAMASAACDRFARVFNLANVLRVDLLDHSHHEASRGFLRLRIVGEIETRFAVGTKVLWVGGVAGAALAAQRGLPLVHQFVNLISGHRFRQNLQVGRCRRGAVRMLVFVGRRDTGRLLG